MKKKKLFVFLHNIHNFFKRSDLMIPEFVDQNYDFNNVINFGGCAIFAKELYDILIQNDLECKIVFVFDETEIDLQKLGIKNFEEVWAEYQRIIVANAELTNTISNIVTVGDFSFEKEECYAGLKFLYKHGLHFAHIFVMVKIEDEYFGIDCDQFYEMICEKQDSGAREITSLKFKEEDISLQFKEEEDSRPNIFPEPIPYHIMESLSMAANQGVFFNKLFYSITSGDGGFYIKSSLSMLAKQQGMA